MLSSYVVRRYDNIIIIINLLIIRPGSNVKIKANYYVSIEGTMNLWGSYMHRLGGVDSAPMGYNKKKEL